MLERKSKNHWWLPKTLVLFLLLALFPTYSVAAEETIVIGYQGPLTGEEAQVGKDELNGVKYAVEVFNEKFAGKFRVVIKEIDDKGDPSVAGPTAEIASKDSTLLGIVGPAYSGATIASLPYYKAANIPLISPSASRISLTDPTQGLMGYPIFHRLALTDKTQGPNLYSVATSGVTNPKVFLVDDQSPYGVGLFQYMKQGISNLNPVGTDSVADSTKDFMSVIQKIKTSGANVVIFGGYYVQSANLFKQLRDAGYKGVLASGDGSLSPGITSIAPVSILDGVRLTGSTVPLGYISPELDLDFRKRFGVSSGTYALESLDAANIYLYCVATGVRTRNSMLTCINQFKGTSVSGQAIAFDANGDRVNPKWYEFWISKNYVGTDPFILMTNTWGTILNLEAVWKTFPWYSLTGATSSSGNTTNSGNSSGNSNSSTGNTSNTNRPSTPTFSLVNFSGNKINVNVNLGASSVDRPDRIYLIAPSLGFNANSPIEGKISGSTASWSLPIGKLISGAEIPIEIVSEKNGVSSESLIGNYVVPNVEVTAAPPAPTNFSSRIVGNSVIVTVQVNATDKSRPSSANLFGTSLGITKINSLQGDLVSNKALFEIPINSSMVGKKYAVTIFLENSKGESKPLLGTISIPGAAKPTKIAATTPKPAAPKTVICVRNNQTRTFEGVLCPPGWEKR